MAPGSADDRSSTNSVRPLGTTHGDEQRLENFRHGAPQATSDPARQGHGSDPLGHDAGSTRSAHTQRLGTLRPVAIESSRARGVIPAGQQQFPQPAPSVSNRVTVRQPTHRALRRNHPAIRRPPDRRAAALHTKQAVPASAGGHNGRFESADWLLLKLVLPPRESTSSDQECTRDHARRCDSSQLAKATTL